jgi:hypothetical protein
LVSPVFSTEAAIQQVLVSDFIVDVEFVNVGVASSELGVSFTGVQTSSRIVGNHFVDYLLKTHVRNVAGLDLSESTFTTSQSAFEVIPTQGLDEARSYFFNICAVDFLSTSTVGTAKFEADVKHLDIVSRTPIIRLSISSNVHAVGRSASKSTLLCHGALLLEGLPPQWACFQVFLFRWACVQQQSLEGPWWWRSPLQSPLRSRRRTLFEMRPQPLRP